MRGESIASFFQLTLGCTAPISAQVSRAGEVLPSKLILHSSAFSLDMDKALGITFGSGLMLLMA